MRKPLFVLWAHLAVIAVLGAAAVYSFSAAIELLHGLQPPKATRDADPDSTKTFYTVVLAASMCAVFGLLCAMVAVRKIARLRSRSKRIDGSSSGR